MADRNAAKYAEVTGEALLGPKRGAQFLTCSMRIYPGRFCKPFYRKRLVKRLKKFLRVDKTQIEIVEMAHGSGTGQFMAQVQAVERGDDSVTSSYRPAPLVPRGLGDIVRQISGHGYLSANDFGWFGNGVPEELKAYLSDSGRLACG